MTSAAPAAEATAPVALPLRPRLLATLALAALALLAVGAGSALPWVVLFAGLRPLPGFVLEGGPLAAVAVAGLALPAVAAREGGARVLRPLAVLAGVAVAVAAVTAGIRIAVFVADPGPAGPLSQPAAGPGAWLTAAGGVLVAATAIVAPVPHRRLGRSGGLRLALAVLLFVAGGIHLLLTPEHLGQSPVLGAGFLAAGLAQLALAAVLVAGVGRADDLVPAATVAVDVALVALYGYAVLVGLPFGGGDEEHAAGLVLGAGEPVDLWGFVDLLAELGALGLAALLLLRAPRAAAEPAPASRP